MFKIIKLFIRSHKLGLVSGVGIFLLIILTSEMFLHNRADGEKKEQFRDSLNYSSKLRAQVERELNSLLYLNSGLGSYLIVRNDNLQQKEVNDILGVLYKSGGHIRNFGIAVGYTIKYVYPHAGNEGAIGLHYPDHPEQWKVVKRCIDNKAPVLAGPIDLVQGGRGLIYRVPLYIDTKYWGLLSTVIDLDSFEKSISVGDDHSEFEFAIRGRDGDGEHGEMVMGRKELFLESDLITQHIDVPGGSWTIAVRSIKDGGSTQVTTLLRVLFYFLALVAAWMMYMLIRSRTDLANLAMYDQLTGLPNRHLLEDRAELAFARQQRRPEQQCAVLFLDLDGFKAINDKYGHKAGDAILLAVAHRLSSIVRGNDTVARWGGDEFIVLLENINEETLQLLMKRIRDEIEAKVKFEDHYLQVGVSIGVAICPKTGGDLDQILKMADQQMYDEKRQRKIG